MKNVRFVINRGCYYGMKIYALLLRSTFEEG